MLGLVSLRWIPWLGALLLLAGCATSQAFIPVAPLMRPGPEGTRAAQYTVERQGQQFGEIQVWSRGAYRTEIEGKARTLVQIGLSLHNTSPAPLEFDPAQLFLDEVALRGGTLYRLAPAQVKGNVPVAPSQTGTLEAYFLLPDDAWPGDVFEYRLAWQVRDAAGAYANRTAFRSTSYSAYDGYYVEYRWGYYPWGYYAWPYPYAGYYAYPGYGYPRYPGARYDVGAPPRFYARPETSRGLAAPRAR
jgi:hypothetical protein